MPIKTIRQAINETLKNEMRRDSTIVVIGEDVAGGAGSDGIDDAAGGVFGVTKGLVGEFGRERVIDTPITEAGFIGMAAGAACTGLRPVVELMFVDFIGVCFDQVFNQTAKFRYMFGGKSETPLVIRSMVGAGIGAAAQHSHMLHPLLASVPGLKVALPSNAYDAKGLLLTAIRDNDPVVFLEHKLLYDMKCEVPDEDYLIPFGQAEFTREGEDITLVSMSNMVLNCNQVADNLSKDGIGVDVIDLRTVSPLDEGAVLESVEVSGRLVIVDEASERCSMASEISSVVAEKAFKSLREPIAKVTAPHTPVPFTPTLEKLYVPSVERIEKAARMTLEA